MSPSTRYVSAPAATHSARVICGASVGMTTRQGSPALAAKAAQADPALPFVGRATPVAPSSAARDTPTAAPRALNEPVGSGLSSFISSRGTPSSAPRRSIGSSGVMPSSKLTTDLAEPTGSSSW